MSVLLLFYLAAVLALAMRVERGIGPTFLLIAMVIPTQLGFYAVSASRGWPNSSWVVVAMPGLLLLGAGTYCSLRSRGRLPGIWQAAPAPNFTDVKLTRALWTCLAVVAAGAAYHFAVGGVAVFSQQVETQRFNFEASGALGAPSRLALYGMPLMALVVLAARRRVPRSLVIATLSAYAITSLALGFKSALADVTVTALVAWSCTGALRPKAQFRTILAAAAASLLAATAIGQRYGTLQASGGVSLNYLWERLTFIAAEPGWQALAQASAITQGRSAVLMDLKYFAGRYLRLPMGQDFPLDLTVSSVITHTPLSGHSFLVPVTVGGATYLSLSMGAVLAGFALAGIGWIWARAAARLGAAVRLRQMFVSAALLHGLRIFILNGGGVYVAINVGATCLLLLAISALVSGPLPFAVRRRPAVLGVGRSQYWHQRDGR